MGKKDKKDIAKKEAKKVRQAVKQNKTAEKRNKKELKETGEKKIEDILAEFSANESRKNAVAITIVPQPSRRANFSMTALSTGEMLMFGGEFFDGETTTVYNDLFKWNIERNEWKQIESLNTPPPRCSHQAVQYQEKMYLFGGEYGTLDQFYHYRDLWELDLKTNTWAEVEATGDWPTARSGHRMVLWRNFIVLFGGFYEAMRDVRWYNDLYFFSLQERRWIAVPAPRQASAQPKPRSGHMMFLHSAEDILYIYGGFAKERTPGVRKEHIEHEDMWSMSLKPLVAAKGAAAVSSTAALDWNKLTWQRVSKKGEYPTARCGAVAVVFKNKALVFGGVFDEEGPRHVLLSSFYNDLFAFDMDRKRWYQLGLKKVKDKAKIQEERTAKKVQRKKAAAVAFAAARREMAGLTAEGNTEDELNENDIPEIKVRKVGYFEEEDEDDDEEEFEDQVIIDSEQGERIASSNVRKDGELFGFIDDNGNVVYLQVDDVEEGDASSGVEDETNTLKQAAIAVETDSGASVSSASKPLPPSVPSDAISPPVPSKKPVAVTIDASTATPATAVGGLALRTMEDVAGYFDRAVEPCARIHACAMMSEASLMIYGGVTEANDIEITLDDCWALDINKRDVWRLVLRGSMHSMEWKGVEEDDQSRTTDRSHADDDDDDDSDASDDNSNSSSSSSSSSSSDEEAEDENSDSDDKALKEKNKKDKKDRKRSQKEKKEKKEKKSSKGDRVVAAEGGDDDGNVREGKNADSSDEEANVGGSNRHGGTRKSIHHGRRRTDIDDLRDHLSLSEVHRTPLAGESLREFYARTAEHWAAEVLRRWQESQLTSNTTANALEQLSEKEIKRQGFALAGERYEALLPVLSLLNEREVEQRVDEEQHRGREHASGTKKDKKDMERDKSSISNDARKKEKQKNKKK